MIDPNDTEANRLFNHFPDDLLKRFKEFHSNNPQVYEEFLKYARDMKQTGHQRYSQYGIMHRIRWENDLKTTGSEFKIDDSFTPVYARLAEYQHPDLKDFFEFRKTWPSC